MTIYAETSNDRIKQAHATEANMDNESNFADEGGKGANLVVENECCVGASEGRLGQLKEMFRYILDE